ncbi:hypothetical protein BMR02_09480 [Methylococcaceae bacterium HT1]|nr:hypothetical protein BMR02_09480 [Methylococcaceae bacterium HT1]TXL14317.1 hypothetical protein BMR05_07845 [Methylococcaceae bacterium HT4]TXL17655.1 hypothetical protein BMR04_04745 [Methylococcaceae bacterium HT3]TXL19777.1 hypothetical protein BMR06_08260 [Methylococcaceae bacterium HT5]TXL21692.1 hypothetical protein BMR03_12535 [Methylococcaceae bacterium HT2]
MTKNSRQQEQAAARDSVIRGNDIHNEVRQIVVDALKDGKMEPEHIKEVLRAVVNGAFEGATDSEPEAKEVLQKTVAGIDDALSQVAQASSLAIEEATGNVDEFTEHDLKRALADLNDLEKLFFDTLTEVAKGGQELTSSTINSIVEHLQQSSTSVGRTVAETSSHLRNVHEITS